MKMNEIIGLMDRWMELRWMDRWMNGDQMDEIGWMMDGWRSDGWMSDESMDGG